MSGFTLPNQWLLIAMNPYVGGIDYCNSQQILYFDNPILDNLVVHRKFTLVPHYQVIISLKFWRIDTWNNKNFTIYANYEKIYDRAFQSQLDITTNLCQDNTINDEEVNIEVSFEHFYPSLTVVLKGEGNRWGISNLKLEIDECPSGCQACNSNGCLDQIQVPILTASLGQSFSCGGVNFIGSTSSSYMETNVNLNPHNKISCAIKFVLQNCNSPTVTLKIDDQIVTTTQKLSSVIDTIPQYCFLIQNLDLRLNEMAHSNPTIKIRIDFVFSQTSPTVTGPRFGVEDFLLFTNQKIIKIIEESNQQPYEGCLLDILQYVEGCIFCVRNICLQCEEGWIYNQQDQSCNPKCGDLKLVQNEECDDGNSIPYDGCHQCKYSCPNFCKQCEKGKCIECLQPYELINQKYIQTQGYYQHIQLNNDHMRLMFSQFLDCNPLNYGIMGYYYNQCQIYNIPLCTNQQWNICLECQFGYELTKSKKQCVSICNDGLIQQFEICDDGNKIQFDGCFQCQQNYQLECLNCVNSKCLLCQEGWYLIDENCIPFCGDGITVPTEQCDDGNDLIGDGCYQCQSECSNCLLCNYLNQCQICQEYFHSVQDICIPICGDNYIVPGLEQCEDGNQLQFDGCYNCQLECNSDCQRCQYGQCHDLCQIDELYIDGKCLKLNPNDVDIQNTNTNYNCTNECLECIQGQCLKCQQQFKLLNGTCLKFLCGDGVLELSEECDDGNILSNDGCSNLCQIESNWICFNKQEQINTCYSLTTSYLQYLNSTNLYQFVQFTYSLKVRLISNTLPQNFINQNSFKILGIQEDNYQITSIPVIPIAQNEHRQIFYDFKIQFYEQIQSKVNFTIFINETIFDENEQSVSPTNISIELKAPKVLTSFQRDTSKTLKTIGYSFMLSIGCSSVIMIILGRFAQTIELIDILQYQQYLKYINVAYPYNVQIYFESSNFISLEPLLNYLKFEDLYQNLIEDNFLESIGKFKEYELNADFLSNFNCFIFQLSIGGAFILMLFIYEKYFSKYISLEKIFSFIRKFNCDLFQQFFINLYIYKKNNLEISKIINRNTFIQFFYANSWDLMFKVGLFLNSYTNSEYRQNISLLICFICFWIMLQIFFYDFRKLYNKLDITKGKQIQHEKLILFKKFSFHFLLTSMQFHPTVQSILMGFFITFYITLALGLKFITSKIEILTTLSLEIPITFHLLLNITYSKDFQSYTTFNQQIYIGFLQIGLLVFSLIGPLVKTVYELYQSFQKYNNKKSKQEIKNIISTNVFVQVF
ncbi:unnamed protein product [Paramecium sonneborni]|uniref:Transmembrane protein n=1 Tax=Paramecium sonneborni TaxID=65129 RepID=A0A8S1RID1_9CILI|nr:unnamed protein product [Paramecium sonneborni]